MNSTLWIIAGFSVFIISIYSSYVLLLLHGWAKTPDFIVDTSEQPNIKVSVIIPARNEAKNIEACLTALFQQNYTPSLFEVILVDDNSTDKTAEIVKNFALAHPSHQLRLLELTDLQNTASPKKRAIEKAIEQSTGDLILMSDADCRVGPLWIKSMVQFYLQHDAKMIVGPVIIEQQELAGFIADFEKLDFFSLMSSGASSLCYNKPLMCNGANLAFEKKTYHAVLPEVQGKHLASGDDMFLMLAIQNKFPDSVKFIKSKEALVKTAAQPNLRALLNQRKRWASKGFSYSNAYLSAVACLIFLVHVTLFIITGISFFHLPFLALFLVLFLGKLLVDFAFLNTVAKLFSERKMLNKILPIEVFSSLFLMLLAFWSLRRAYTWKGRKLT